MLKTFYRIVRATAFALAMLEVPALIIYGILHGWGLAEYEAALGLGGLAGLFLMWIGFGGKMGPGYGGPAISGDEVGRPIG